MNRGKNVIQVEGRRVSLFIVKIPKNTAETSKDRESTLEALNRNSDLFLGPRYAKNPVVHTDLNPSGAWIAEWHAANGKDYDTFAKTGGRWCVSSANQTASRLARNLRSRAGAAYFSEPVWGSFATVHGDSSAKRILAWNTVPAMDPIYFCDSQEHFLISNRPIICKLAELKRRVRIEDLNHEYLAEYLEFGYSISGISPFKSVATLPSRSALSISGRSFTFVAAPIQPTPEIDQQSDPRRYAAPELATALENAASRCFARSSYRDLQIRLSGGLDSRFLLGLFSKTDFDEIKCVTHGVASDKEVAIASQLASMAGVPHVIKAPEPLVRFDYLSSLVKSIKDSGGLIPSESLVAPFSPTNPSSNGGAITLGQWPLFKGYLDGVPTADENEVLYRIFTRGSGLVNDELSEYCSDVLERWLSSMVAVSNAEVLYNFARDMRSSRYLEAQTSQTDRDCQVSYPMADSEVTALSDAIPIENRAPNYVSFFALQQIWPEALTVPLNTTKTLRFEANGPLAGVSGLSFKNRRGEPSPFTGFVHEPVYKGTDFAKVMGAIEFYAAEYVAQSSVWQKLRPMLDSSTVQLVETIVAAGPSRSASLFSSYVEKKSKRVALSRLALAAMWAEGAWL